MISSSDAGAYIQRRLANKADEARDGAARLVTRIVSELAGKGQLNNSRAYVLINEELVSHYRRVLLQMSKFTYHAAEGDVEKASGHLEAAAQRLAEDIFQDLNDRYRRMFVSDGTRMTEQDLKRRMVAESAAIVDDFAHGIAEESKMKKDPVISVVSNIVNSPGAVQQSGIGSFTQSGFQQQIAPLMSAVSALLVSKEFQGISGPHQEALRDVAEVILSEARKTDTPDPSKLRRWTQRLIALAEEFGLHTAAHTIGSLLAKALGS